MNNELSLRDWHEMTQVEFGNLSREEVEAIARYECMEAGVPVSGSIPELEEESIPDIPKSSFYRVAVRGEDGRWGSAESPIFGSKEDAMAFIALKPTISSSKYIESESYEYHQQTVTREVEEVMLASEQDILNLNDVLAKAAVAKKRNAEIRKKLAERHDQASKVTNPMWERWNECREYVSSLESVRETWREYGELARDADARVSCMRKAYPAQEQLLADAVGDEWPVRIEETEA